MSLEKELDIVDEMKEIRKNAKKFGIELELVKDSILFDEDVLDVIVINVSKGNNTLTEVAVPSEVSKDDIILTVRELLMIMVDEEVFNKAVTKEVEDVHRGIFKK
jgi:hypothetical protein